MNKPLTPTTTRLLVEALRHYACPMSPPTEPKKLREWFKWYEKSSHKVKYKDIHKVAQKALAAAEREMGGTNG